MPGPARSGSPAEKIVAVTDAVAAARSLDELQHIVLDTMSRLLPVRSHAVYLLDPAKGTPLSYATQGASDAFLARYEEIGRPADPLLHHCLTTTDVAHSSRLLGESAWVAEPVYRDVMALHGWRMVLEAPVVAGSVVLGTLNFADRNGALLTSDDEIALAAALGRVVGLASAGLMQQEGLRRERDRLVAAFDLADDALILTDLRTGDRLLNSAARAQLARVAPHSPREWLEDAMTAAAPPSAGATFVVSTEAGELTASLRTAFVSEGSGTSVAVLRVRGVSAAQPRELPPSLEKLLSPREKEVARLAVAGLRDDQIAAKVFLSRYTVKQHLRSVYRKLGVDSRIALTRLALTED